MQATLCYRVGRSKEGSWVTLSRLRCFRGMSTQKSSRKLKHFAIGRRRRILLVLLIACYVAFFHWIYLSFLYPYFAYLGFEYSSPPLAYVLLAWVLSLLPALGMPIGLTRPSHLAYWVLYVTVLIPSMFVPLYAG